MPSKSYIQIILLNYTQNIIKMELRTQPLYQANGSPSASKLLNSIHNQLNMPQRVNQWNPSNHKQNAWSKKQRVRPIYSHVWVNCSKSKELHDKSKGKSTSKLSPNNSLPKESTVNSPLNYHSRLSTNQMQPKLEKRMTAMQRKAQKLEAHKLIKSHKQNLSLQNKLKKFKLHKARNCGRKHIYNFLSCKRELDPAAKTARRQLSDVSQYQNMQLRNNILTAEYKSLLRFEETLTQEWGILEFLRMRKHNE